MMKLIQVGVGGYGSSWLSTVMESQRAQHVALVDLNLEHLKQAREITGLPDSVCFTNLEQALMNGIEADALLCIVPPAYHESVIRIGVSAGMHILSEKPIAHTIQSAHQILQRFNKTDRIFMISQKARFHPWVRRFRQIVNSGQLGQISHVTHYFRAPYYSWGEFRHQMQDPLYIEMSIHHFDLLRALLGCDPVQVWSTSWNTPYSTFAGDITGVAHFVMDNGWPITYHADAIASGDMTDWYGEIRAVGEDGTLTMIYPELYIAKKGANHTDRQAPQEFIMKVSNPQEGQLVALYEFLDAIKENRTPESSGQDNLKSLAMVFGAIDASRDQEFKQIDDYLL